MIDRSRKSDDDDTVVIATTKLTINYANALVPAQEHF